MGIGKRQLVLAALVVALGAAVYLNWQFSGDNQLMVADAAALSPTGETSEKELGTAELVGYSEETGGEGEPAQAASAAPAEASGSVSEYFTEARLSRQKSRDSAVDLLEQVLESVDSDEEAKKEAVAQAAEIAQNEIQESNIENMIKAKGFEDCMVFLQNEECSVVVQTDGDSLLPNQALAIKDIVGGQSGTAYDKIKIIEAK